jgi:hypothetical protein
MVDGGLVWFVGALRVETSDPSHNVANVRVLSRAGSLVWSGSVTLDVDDVETVDWPVALALDTYTARGGVGQPWEVVESRGAAVPLVDGAREVVVGSRDLETLRLPEDFALTLEVRHGLCVGADYVIRTSDGARVGVSTPRPDRLTGLLPVISAGLRAAGL